MLHAFAVKCNQMYRLVNFIILKRVAISRAATFLTAFWVTNPSQARASYPAVCEMITQPGVELSLPIANIQGLRACSFLCPNP